MQVLKLTRKVYMSILTVVLLVTTMFATTFAWVGILTYSELENFELNLKVDNISSDYNLLVSLTGEEGTFKEEVNMSEIRLQIMENIGVDISFLEGANAQTILTAFNYLKLAPVSPEKNGNQLENFKEYDIHEKNFFPSTSYFKFDLYFSVDRKNKNDSLDESQVYIDSGIIFQENSNIMVGEICSTNVINGIIYPSDGLYEHPGFDINKQLVSIDSSYATRLALQVYDPIDISSEYSSEALANSLYIFKKGGQLPSYNETTDTYSFGGILPEEYNLAFKEFKSSQQFGSWFSIPSNALARGDEEIEIGERQLVLVNEEDGTFGITAGVANKVKISVYFWYEGWDSDCFNALAGSRTTINLSFTASEEQEE